MKHYRKVFRKILLFLITIPVLLFIFSPILWLFFASLSTQVELFMIPPHWIPQHPTLQNYLDIFLPSLAASTVPRTFAISLLNSIKIASAVTIICIVIGSLAAYALVRIPFKFNRYIQLGILTTRMIPEVSLILPLFIIASSLQLIYKPIVLVITYMSFALPYAIWMMAAFFQTVPVELEEAARIDGGGRLRIFFSILLPISVPGLVAAGAFSFLLAWKEFMWASIMISTGKMKPIAVGMRDLIGQGGTVDNMSYFMAIAVATTIPAFIFFLLVQKHVASGLTAGAVKG